LHKFSKILGADVTKFSRSRDLAPGFCAPMLKRNT